MNLKTQNFLIVGMSKSGVSATNFLISKGVECYIYEELSSPKIDEGIKSLIAKGATRISSAEIEETMKKIDIVVLSPGVPINHEIPMLAKKLGKKLTGELELAASFITSPIIAVTGTNGKTTTVSMISSIMRETGEENFPLGNIGTPVSSKIDELNNGGVPIIEVSSFQLETVSAFKPHIAVVLNISPDHLERHYTMDNYIFLKKRILKNLTESEYAALNYDDEIVAKFAYELKVNIVWFSKKAKIDGAYLLDGKLFYKDEFIMNASELSLKNDVNIENALAAIAVTKIMKIKNEAIVKGLSEFKGIRHRMEIVKTIDGITYINDSKGTNTNATITAINSLSKPTILILGGKDKGENYDKLFEKISVSVITGVVLLGESKYKMLDSAGKAGYRNITLCSDFDSGVKIAKLLSESGGNVLLSPATASFDMFSSYEERGDRFCKIVEEFNEKKSDKEE